MSVTIQKSTSGAIFYIQNPGESESTPYTVNDFDMIPTGDGISLSLVRKFRRTVVNDQINSSDIILKQPYTNVINGDTGIAFASYGAYRTYIETNFFRKAGGGSGSLTWGSITGTITDQSDLQAALNSKATYPAQTGNTGKFLTTDGSNVSWATAGQSTGINGLNGTTSIGLGGNITTNTNISIGTGNVLLTIGDIVNATGLKVRSIAGGGIVSTLSGSNSNGTVIGSLNLDNAGNITMSTFSGTTGSTLYLRGKTASLQLINDGANTFTDSGGIGLQYFADYSASYTDRSLIDRGFANASYIPLTFSSPLDANILGQGLNFVLDSGTDHLRLSMGDSSLTIFGYDTTGANCSLVNAPTTFAVNASDSGSLSQASINVRSSGDNVSLQLKFQDLGSGHQHNLFFGVTSGSGIILEDSIDNIGFTGDSDYSTNAIANDLAYTQVSTSKKLINKGPQQLSTTDRVALTPSEGDQVYDITLHKLYVYDGTTWQGAW